MLKVVTQSVLLPAPAKTLYAQYLAPKIHAAITGHKVLVGARTGARFSAFNKALSGRTLYTDPGRLIVQAWRSAAFHEDDIDSTLVLRFLPEGREGRIDLVHVNVPAHDYRGVQDGWKKYYWRPWREYLSRGRAGR